MCGDDNLKIWKNKNVQFQRSTTSDFTDIGIRLILASKNRIVKLAASGIIQL